jgi:hypothetical protein
VGGNGDRDYIRVRFLCEPCVREVFDGRMSRAWVPLGEPTEAQLQWLEEAKTLMGPKVDALRLGEHLLKLLPVEQDLEDPRLLKAVDQFPFTKLGTAQTGTNYLDLSVLLRCWSRGLLVADCPKCQASGGFYVYQISGSVLSGLAYVWGICRTCGQASTKASTGPQDNMSHWYDNFPKASRLFGRPLTKPKNR